MKLRVTHDARDDLEGLRSHIVANAGAGIADMVIGRIGTGLSTLAAFPHIGHGGHVPGTFEMVVPRLPFVVVYRVDFNDIERELVVLRVYHTARDRE